MRRWRLLAASSLLASTATACGLLLGIGDETFTSPEDAGSDAVVVVTPDAGPRCGAEPPARPSGGDVGGAMRVFAFLDARIGSDPDGGQAGGYDLDGVCTCDPADHSPEDGGSSCMLPSNSSGVCDEEAGIDDAVGHLLDSIGYLNAGTLVDVFNDQLHCGHVGVLVVVTGYNGLRDDPEVGLTFVPSPGIQEPHADDGGENPDPSCFTGDDGGIPFYQPRFDQTDLWSVLDGSIDRTGQPDPVTILRGWVRDYQVVVDARDGGGQLRFPVGGIPLVVRAPIITARLVGTLPDGGVTDAGATESTGFALREGLATGRVAASDLLESLSAVPIRGSGMGNFTFLCSDPTKIDFAKATLCPGRDITASPKDDGRGVPCDAVSLVLRFVAAPATLGDAGQVTSDAACSTPIDASCEGF